MTSENLKIKSKKFHTQYIKMLYRFLGDQILPTLKNLNVTANQITLSRIIFVLLGSILILSESNYSKILTFIFFFIFSLFDALDGSLARITKKSFMGMWLDTVIDRVGLTIIFLFIGIKIYISIKIPNYLVIINFLILIFYFIKYGILTDISLKHKYKNFRDFDENFKNINNEFPINEKVINIFSLDFLIKNFNFKTLIKFLHHQFSPHTFNLIIYLSIINLIEIYYFGLISLLSFYIIWLTYDIYKITKISIILDKNNSDE